MPNPKNIVICCDGTDNQFSGDHTNVIRTYKVAVRSPQQVTYYNCGVGTIPEPWNTGHISQRWSILKGLAMGSGFMQNIEDAYRFLMLNYKTGDKIYLFGFSRGAFTVRALAGMLYSVGLLYPGSENLIRYAQEYWQKDHRSRNQNAPKSAGQRLCEEFKKTLARSCPVHFIGAWDTVSSVGIINQFKSFPFTARNPEVSHVRHAVSIDERRSCFRQNLMFQAYPSQDIKNVWFAGVHADVGGGYPSDQSGLAKLTFEWMMREAAVFGFQIDTRALQHELYIVGSSPNKYGVPHNQLIKGWWLLELIPMKKYRQIVDKKTNKKIGKHKWVIPMGKTRDVMRNAADDEVFLHQSVLDRIQGSNSSPKYTPTNISNDLNVLVEKFKIEK